MALGKPWQTRETGETVCYGAMDENWGGRRKAHEMLDAQKREMEAQGGLRFW